MRYRLGIVLAVMTAIAMSRPANAQTSREPATVLQQPIMVQRTSDVETIPLVPHMGKFAIRAAMNGTERSFIFDTGSPTMISRELAEELDLTVIGSNTGRDANGRDVRTDIAVVRQLTIGGLTFADVPVLIADLRDADPDGCVFDGGVIGSEIFPGNVWHIDGAQNQLKIAAKLEDIPGLRSKPASVTTELHIGGYPYPPVFPYAFGSFRDRALFDTGNSDTIILYDRVFRVDQVQRSIVSGSLRRGRGSLGVSAGGAGDETDLLRFDLQGLTLGAELPRLPGTIRDAPPSLIGLGILDRYSVTLDYPGKRMLLHERAGVSAPREHPGYAIGMTGDTATVVQLFDGSAAKRAGLRLGDTVLAIDGRSLLGQPDSCVIARWLVEDRPTSQARTLSVMRNGQALELTVTDQ